MKTKFITFLAAGVLALSAGAQIQTRVLGNTLATNSLVVASSPTTLYAVTGYSASTQYIMVFQTNAVPANGATAVFSVPVSAGQYYSLDFSTYGAALDKVTVCNSTTPNTLTLGATDTTFQAIIRAN